MSSVRPKRVTKITVLVLVVVGLVLVSLFGVSQWLSTPLSKTSDTVVVEVLQGDDLSTLSQRMQDQAVIRSSLMFRLTARQMDSISLYAGNFSIDRSWSLRKMLQTLSDPANILPEDTEITFLPSEWAKGFAHLLSTATNLSADELLSAWNDDDYLRDLIADYPFLSDAILNDQRKVKLEGYLAPDTYRFAVDTTIDEVTRKILDNTAVILDPYLDQIAASGMSIDEVVTLASVVNYEAASEEDMKLVAGVFFNRLSIGMKLESSVTACYALYEYDSWQDCETNVDIDSPYNTYRVEGLPVGPVMNPSALAIEAVLNPTTSDYYFFVADPQTGQMYFAKTYEEHLENKAKYVDIYQ